MRCSRGSNCDTSPANLLKIIFFANTDWYLYNFRLALAKYLRQQRLEVVMLSPVGPYGELLRAEGFRWIGLDMNRRSLNPGRELALVRRIAAVYAAEKPDIVHHFTIKCVVYGSLIARWLGIRNRVNAVTGLGYVFSADGFRARLLRPVVRRLIRAALSGEGSCLILQNKDDVAAFVATHLAGKDRTHLIMGSGVDTTLFRPRDGERQASPVMRVLLASRLLWDKGIREYIEAARLLRAEGLAVEFLLAGSPDPGNPASVPTSQVAKWQKAGSVTYLGHVSDMPRLLREIDVAVLPSYREGVPRSLLEAAACALPIVTTDVPGCREVVSHGVNGLLVPPRDAKALAAAIRSLYEAPAERLRMGRAAREIAVSSFDQTIVFEKTLGVYRELLTAAL
jgi:glycosyltransferase involved in cell wall biosynthesis